MFSFLSWTPVVEDRGSVHTLTLSYFSVFRFLFLLINKLRTQVLTNRITSSCNTKDLGFNNPKSLSQLGYLGNQTRV